MTKDKNRKSNQDCCIVDTLYFSSLSLSQFLYFCLSSISLLLLYGFVFLLPVVVCYSEKNGGLFEHLKHREGKKQQPSSCKKLRQYAKRKKKEIAFYIHTFPRSAACAVFLFYRFNILSSSSSSLFFFPLYFYYDPLSTHVMAMMLTRIRSPLRIIVLFIFFSFFTKTKHIDLCLRNKNDYELKIDSF